MSKLEPGAGSDREHSPKKDDDQTPSGASLHSTRVEAFYGRLEYHETLSSLPAEELERIEKLAPGSTRGLVDLAISQAKHRMNIESRIIESHGPRATRGQVFSFILVILDLIATTLLIALGHAPYGFAMFVVMVVAVVVISLWNRYQDRRERIEKVRLLPRPAQPDPNGPPTGRPPPLPLTEAGELAEVESDSVGSDQGEPSHS